MLNVHVLVAIDDLARSQHGVLTHDQLLASGLTWATISRWVSQNRLMRVAPDVYRLPGAPETWRQRVMISCLTTKGFASHRTAAALWGLDGFPSTIIEIVTERWKRRPRMSFIVHESTSLRDVDADERDGIPCTTLVRTLIDLPQVCGFDHTGIALDHARRRDPGVLIPVKRRFLEVARRGRPGTTKMRLLLADRLGEAIPPDSYFETKFLRLVRRHGIKEPAKQLVVRSDDGTTYRLDFAWADEMVYAECNGYAYHSGKREMQRDSTRRRKLVLAGWQPLDYTYEDVAQRPDLVARELELALLTSKARK